MSIDIGYSSPEDWEDEAALVKKNAELRRRVAQLECYLEQINSIMWDSFGCLQPIPGGQIMAVLEKYAANEPTCTCCRKLNGVPTEPGTYWYQYLRFGHSKQRAVTIVRDMDGDLIVRRLGRDDTIRSYMDYWETVKDGTWYGPICEPEDDHQRHQNLADEFDKEREYECRTPNRIGWRP